MRQSSTLFNRQGTCAHRVACYLVVDAELFLDRVHDAVVAHHGFTTEYGGTGIDHHLVFNGGMAFQVSIFLVAFSGLYFTVYAVTDSTYREEFESMWEDSRPVS